MQSSTIRFSTFPRTDPPPDFVADVVGVFRKHESEIATETNEKGPKSDDVLAVIGPNLAQIGFQVEASKKRRTSSNAPSSSGRTASPPCDTR